MNHIAVASPLEKEKRGGVKPKAETAPARELATANELRVMTELAAALVHRLRGLPPLVGPLTAAKVTVKEKANPDPRPAVKVTVKEKARKVADPGHHTDPLTRDNAPPATLRRARDRRARAEKRLVYPFTR